MSRGFFGRLFQRPRKIPVSSGEPEQGGGRTGEETLADLDRLAGGAMRDRVAKLQGKGFFRAFEPGTAPPEDEE